MPGTSDPARRDVNASVRRPALLAVLCFILGIAVHGRLPHYPQVWLALVLLLGACGAVLFHRSRLCGAALMLALVCAGTDIAQIEAFYYPPTHISAYATDDPRLAWL